MLAQLVDRVVPDVPVRQYVLTLPYELRKVAAFKADVLTASPTASDLDAIVERTARRSMRWLRKRSYIDDTSLEARSNEPPAQTALDACAAIAMGRGTVATLPRDGEQGDAHGDTEARPDKPVLAVERDGLVGAERTRAIPAHARTRSRSVKRAGTL
jgi:hypothetical protein